ncbi:MAG: hypothetical protein MJ232_02540 [archaeon]|nr:hypothetical protein [archaeon]
MGKILKYLGIIILICVIVGLILSATCNVLILAADTSEKIPGVDMAAMWNAGEGFQWIYPGSSFNAQHHTLHNIYMDSNEPYAYAKDIIQYTYNKTPNICVVVDNDAAQALFGDHLIDNIRQHDWGEGNSRGDSIMMSITSLNPLAILPSILSGHIQIFPI